MKQKFLLAVAVLAVSFMFVETADAGIFRRCHRAKVVKRTPVRNVLRGAAKVVGRVAVAPVRAIRHHRVHHGRRVVWRHCRRHHGHYHHGCGTSCGVTVKNTVVLETAPDPPR